MLEGNFAEGMTVFFKEMPRIVIKLFGLGLEQQTME